MSIGRPLDIRNWLGWIRSDSDQTMTLILTSLDQFVDVILVFWRPLDVLGTSLMLCKCQFLTKDVHSRFWPKYDFLTSPRRPMDVTNVMGRSEVQTWRQLDVPLTSRLRQFGRPIDEKSVNKWRKYDIRFWRLWTSEGRPSDVFGRQFGRPYDEKSVNKMTSYDVRFWRHTDQKLTSYDVQRTSCC